MWQTILNLLNTLLKTKQTTKIQEVPQFQPIVKPTSSTLPILTKNTDLDATPILIGKLEFPPLNLRHIDFLICHRTEEGFTGVEVNQHEHPNSYHTCVRQNGVIDYMIPWTDVAFHALKFNKNSIGICLYGNWSIGEHSINNKVIPIQFNAAVDIFVEAMKFVKSSGQNFPKIVGHSQLGKDGTAIPEKLQISHYCPGTLWPLSDMIRQVNNKLGI